MLSTQEQSDLARQRRDSDNAGIDPARTPDPLLSVVVTAHNDGAWIREALESLTSQDFSDVELIVVDDHSHDETPEIVAELAALDPRIRLITPDGRGAAHARNLGARFARGKYLAFCDGDGIIPEHGYAALMGATAQSPDIVCGDFLHFGSHVTSRPSQGAGLFSSSRDGLTLDAEPALLGFRAGWNKIFRTGFWREHDIVFPEVPHSFDLAPMTEAYLLATSISVIEHIVYLHRTTPELLSPDQRRERFLTYLEQEISSAQLLRQHRHAAGQRQHTHLIANSVGWARVRRYLKAIDKLPVDDALRSTLSTFTALIDDREIAVTPLRRRVVLGICESGDLTTAAIALSLVDQLHEQIDAEWLTTWTAVLSAAEPDSRFFSKDDVGRRWIARGASHLLVQPPEQIPAEELRALLLQLPRPTVLSGPIASVDLRSNRGLTTLMAQGPEAFRASLGPVQDAAASIETLSHRRGRLRLTGTVRANQPVAVKSIAVVTADRNLHQIGTAKMVRSPGGAQSWIATINRSRLSNTKTLPLVLMASPLSSPDNTLLLCPRLAQDFCLGDPKAADQMELNPGKGLFGLLRVAGPQRRGSRWRRIVATRRR